MSLSEFGPRQFKYGVRVTAWGRNQRLKSAFMIGRFGSHVFKNTRELNPNSGRKNAIEKLWGPSIPKEIIKGEALRAFENQLPHLAARAEHELRNLMRVSRHEAARR